MEGGAGQLTFIYSTNEEGAAGPDTLNKGGGGGPWYTQQGKMQWALVYSPSVGATGPDTLTKGGGWGPWSTHQGMRRGPWYTKYSPSPDTLTKGGGSEPWYSPREGVAGPDTITMGGAAGSDIHTKMAFNSSGVQLALIKQRWSWTQTNELKRWFILFHCCSLLQLN